MELWLVLIISVVAIALAGFLTQNVMKRSIVHAGNAENFERDQAWRGGFSGATK